MIKNCRMVAKRALRAKDKDIAVRKVKIFTEKKVKKTKNTVWALIIAMEVFIRLTVR